MTFKKKTTAVDSMQSLVNIGLSDSYQKHIQLQGIGRRKAGVPSSRSWKRKGQKPGRKKRTEKEEDHSPPRSIHLAEAPIIVFRVEPRAPIGGELKAVAPLFVPSPGACYCCGSTGPPVLLASPGNPRDAWALCLPEELPMLPTVHVKGYVS